MPTPRNVEKKKTPFYCCDAWYKKMKSWPFWGWCGILQSVSVESEKYWQVCMWIWNSRKLLKLRELLNNKQGQIGYSGMPKNFIYIFIYLLCHSFSSTVLLCASAPAQQFSPGCSLLMCSSASKAVSEISSATEIRSTIAPSRHGSPGGVTRYNMGCNIMNSTFVQGKDNLLSCSYLTQEKSLPYYRNRRCHRLNKCYYSKSNLVGYSSIV